MRTRIGRVSLHAPGRDPRQVERAFRRALELLGREIGEGAAVRPVSRLAIRIDGEFGDEERLAAAIAGQLRGELT